MFGVDMWADARREFHDEVIPVLRKIGRDVGAGGQAGDELCKRIMGHYGMLVQSFDPMFYGLLKDDLEKYLAREAKNV